WSSPPPQIPFPPLPSILSPPSHVLSSAPPPIPIRSLGYRAAMIRLVGGYMREFETRVRQDTDEIYMRRQTVILEMLREDHRRFTEIIELRTALQGQVTALQ
nr:hypothetical protein [Tanacetum cinerariifolium]